jgi:hypothetical protein
MKRTRTGPQWDTDEKLPSSPKRRTVSSTGPAMLRDGEHPALSLGMFNLGETHPGEIAARKE